MGFFANECESVMCSLLGNHSPPQDFVDLVVQCLPLNSPDEVRRQAMRGSAFCNVSYPVGTFAMEVGEAIRLMMRKRVMPTDDVHSSQNRPPSDRNPVNVELVSMDSKSSEC